MNHHNLRIDFIELFAEFRFRILTRGRAKHTFSEASKAAWNPAGVNDGEAHGLLEILDIRESSTAINENGGFMIGETASVACGAGRTQRSHGRICLRIAQSRAIGFAHRAAVREAGGGVWVD